MTTLVKMLKRLGTVKGGKTTVNVGGRINTQKGHNVEPGDINKEICLTYPQVVERNQARDELAVEEVVCGVDGPDAGVGVIVGVHAEAEGLQGPLRLGAPVVRVVAEAVHPLRQTLLH